MSKYFIELESESGETLSVYLEENDVETIIVDVDGDFDFEDEDVLLEGLLSLLEESNSRSGTVEFLGTLVTYSFSKTA